MNSANGHLAAIARLRKWNKEISKESTGMETHCLQPTGQHFLDEIKRLTDELEAAIKKGEITLDSILTLIHYASCQT